MSPSPERDPYASADDEALPEREVKMSLWEHLDELRSRVVRCALALLVTSSVCWAFREQLLALLIRPYEAAWLERGLPGSPELQTLSPTDPFIGYMQLSLVGGVVCAAPIVFYQLWAFISPGLYAREKRFVVPFVFFSTLLFAAGVAFCYFIAFPMFFDYFFSLLGKVSDAGTTLTQRPTLSYFLDFTTRLLLAFGCVFELPLLLTFLAIAGVVTPKQLISAGRYAIVASFIVAAIITPGGEITAQVLLSSALIALYYSSVLLAYLFGRKQEDDAADAS